MFDHTPLLMVEDDEGVRALAERLSEATVIGVDTESDSMYHYQEKVCLLQFTDAHGDIILDPLGCTDFSPLEPIFADPNIVKMFHGADYDIVCMKRDFGFQTHNLFDTLIAAQFLGLKGLGLADLIDRFFGIPIDKQYQRHDWSKRPLLKEHLDYARGDTHWLLALRTLLTRRLEKAGRLEHHLEECALVENREWAGRSFDEDGYLRIKGAGRLSDESLRILRRLYLYRDGQARKLDRPTYKVLGDQVLVDLAVKKPTTKGELDQLFPRQHGMKRRHTQGILASVSEGLEDDFEIPTPEVPKDEPTSGPPSRLRGRAADKVQEHLKQWRNALTKKSHLYNPFSVASNSDLKEIARARPLNLEELAALPGIRSWQVRDYGETILELLEEVAPADDLGSLSEEGGGRRRRRRR